MKILSIDVGIKNLALCLFVKSPTSDHFKVSIWDIIDISEQENAITCQVVEKNVICNKPAKFKKGEIVESGTHESLLNQNGYYQWLFENQTS